MIKTILVVEVSTVSVQTVENNGLTAYSFLACTIHISGRQRLVKGYSTVSHVIVMAHSTYNHKEDSIIFRLARYIYYKTFHNSKKNVDQNNTAKIIIGCQHEISTQGQSTINNANIIQKPLVLSLLCL